MLQRRAAAAARLVGAGFAVALARLIEQDTSDDAWISWRYAWNLVHGHGLRYNPGAEPAEGYSNLLWTLWASFGIALHVPVERWCHGSGLLFTGITAWLAGSLAWKLTGSRLAELAGVLLVAVSPTLAFTATSGLETPLLVLLVTLSLRLAAEGTARGQLGSAVAAGLAAITHVEGPVFLLVPFAGALLGPTPSRRQWGTLAAAALGPFVLQELFRRGYYGAWLPLTFQVKLSGAPGVPLLNGVRMLLCTLTLNEALVAVALWGAWKGGKRSALLLAPIVGAAIFVLAANGDELNGLRFVAAARPAVAALVGVAAAAWAGRSRLGAAFAACVVLGLVAWDSGTADIHVGRVNGSDPHEPRDTLRAALTPPWSYGAHLAPFAPYLGAGPRMAGRTEPEWFIKYLLENVPADGAFTFADVGMVGYALNGADLWDLRGLNWPATAAFNAASSKYGSDSPEYRTAAAALVDDFARRAPDVVVMHCDEQRVTGRSEMEIAAHTVFTANYEFVARGAYFGISQEHVCVFRLRGARRPDPEVVLQRKQRILREMPGTLWPEGTPG